VKWLLAAVAIALLAIGTAAVLLRADGETPPSRGKDERVAARVRSPTAARALRIEARRVSLYDQPWGRVIGSIDRTTEFGSPEVLPMVMERKFWVGVRHTSLGNRIAWIKAQPNAFIVREQPVLLEVDLSERQLTVKAGRARLRQISVAIGAPETPTPPGDYYVTDKLRGADFGAFYGCCILALSGTQPNLPEGWSGGDRLAIHGSPTPTWGQNVSNGCFHAREADLRYLLKTVPLGTVVTVRA
jgi:lipoprotein-anchoring transpeptidase ErfK/SrfK